MLAAPIRGRLDSGSAQARRPPRMKPPKKAGRAKGPKTTPNMPMPMPNKAPQPMAKKPGGKATRKNPFAAGKMEC